MKRFAIYAGVAVALFLALTLTEIISSGDPFSPVDFGFDLFETALLALAVVFTSYSAQEIREARSESRNLAANLSLARADGERWRAAAATHANGLGFAIRQQFAEWRLTASECDVAILMLKDFHTRRSPISEIRAPQPFVSRRRRSTANPASQAAQSWLHTSSRTCSRRRKIAATAPPLPAGREPGVRRLTHRTCVGCA